MNKTKISKIITKFLLSVIFTLSSLIYINASYENRNTYKKFVFEKSFDFSVFNKYFSKFIGSKLINDTNNTAKTVFNETGVGITTFDSGTKFKYDIDTPVSLIESGIVVYMGQKEDYGNTIIIQGIDGYDFWYCGIDNNDIAIYDYLVKGSIIGTSDEFILIIKKGDKYISYEEYLKQV